MKRYVFVGDYVANNGPANVNKGIIKNLTQNFDYVKCSNKYLKVAEIILKISFCDVVVVSGVSLYTYISLKIASLLHKKKIYIMHGCYEIESALNETAIDEKSLQMEKYILHSVDLLLPVSKRYGQVIQEKYPFCKGKTAYLHNGVDKVSMECEDCMREKGRVIAVGGDRKLKNNITVAKAMNKLDDTKVLMVYGHLYHPESLPKGDNIEFKGLVPQKQLYEEMQKSELFVLNSTFESFGLTVFDALQCGCSVLVSNIAGALDILNTTQHDVIYNPMDEDEVAEKIDYLLQNPNNSRLVKGLDFEKISYKAEVERLEQFCRKLSGKVGAN